jgi:hypothetical protein
MILLSSSLISHYFFAPAATFSLTGTMSAPIRNHQSGGGPTVIHNARLGNGREISELVSLARHNLPQNSAHNLARSSFRQIVDQELHVSRGVPQRLRMTHNLLRRGEWTDDLADLQCQLLVQVGLLRALRVELWLHGHKGIDGLSGDIVCASNDSSFGNALMENQGRFYLGR